MTRLPACLFASASLAALLSSSAVYAQGHPLVLEGKDGWLFGRHELPDLSEQGDMKKAVALVARLNQVLSRSDVHLVMSVIPSKIETHAEYLPDGFVLQPHVVAWYGEMVSALRQQGVRAVDLKPAMLKAGQEWRTVLPYFKYDTHWTPLGATVAAWAIRQDLIRQPDIVKALDQLPADPSRLRWQANATPQHSSRDLASLLPDSATRFPPEQVRRSSLKQMGKQSLLDDDSAAHLALVGSSMSGEGSGFADALRYSFQRKVFNYAINADVGPWVAIRNYLRFVSQKEMEPKVIIWEMPQRALSMLPNHPVRQSQFRMPEADWLLEVLAYADRQCAPPAGAAAVKADEVSKDGAEGFHIQVQAGAPLGYARVKARAESISQVDVAYATADGKTSTRTLELPGDDGDYVIKLPLAVGNQTVQGVSVVPARGSRLKLDAFQVCSYPVSVQP